MATLHPALAALGDGYMPSVDDVVILDYPGGYNPYQSAAGAASNVLASGVASGAPPSVTAVNAAGAAATAAAPALFGSAAAIAIPVIGAAVAGVTFWLMRNRINNIRKEQATQVVNEAEAKMKENLEAYMNGPRTISSQRQALANFDALWDYIVRGCTAVGGDPGRRCIEERQRGGSAPWCPTGTGCDYFTLYRDPIAKDTPRPDPVNATIDPVTGALVPLSDNGLLLPLLLAGAGIILLMRKEDE
jgi:hypothetical protein